MKKSGGFTYLGLAVALATWYNLLKRFKKIKFFIKKSMHYARFFFTMLLPLYKEEEIPIIHIYFFANAPAPRTRSAFSTRSLVGGLIPSNGYGIPRFSHLNTPKV